MAHRMGLKCILIEDDCEEMVRDLNRKEHQEQGSKDFVNRMLRRLGREFGIPVIFITNRPDLLDPATIRRIMPIYYVKNIPLEERKKIITDMVKTNIGITLKPTEAEKMADRTEYCTIGVIETIVKSVGTRKDLKNRAEKMDALAREVERGLRVRENGEMPAPHIDRSTELRTLRLDLINSTDNISQLFGSLISAAKKDRDSLRGMDMALLGPAGSGRKSLARYFMHKVGIKTREISFDLDNTHAEDIEQADKDGRALIIKDAEPLVFKMAYPDNPLIQRMRDRRLPTFVTADMPHDTFLPDNISQAFTFAIRTGYLSEEQIVVAGEKILGTRLNLDSTKHVLDRITIGDVVAVQRQLVHLGAKNDAKIALQRLIARQRPAKPAESGQKIGF